MEMILTILAILLGIALIIIGIVIGVAETEIGPVILVGVLILIILGIISFKAFNPSINSKVPLKPTIKVTCAGNIDNIKCDTTYIYENQ